MRNILNEKPNTKLYSSAVARARFVDDEDIQEKKVLDIGCGSGWCELNFLNRGANKIVGIEISENDLKTAKENVINEKVDFKVANTTNLPFKDQSFDTVVCWEVLEHIPKDTENIMFSEVDRVLKKRGMFYLSTQFDSIFAKILDPAWWFMGHRHYSKERLEKYGEDNGFEVSKVWIRGGWYSLLLNLNMYISKWIFRRHVFFKNYFHSKSTQEYKRNNGFVVIFVKYKKL